MAAYNNPTIPPGVDIFREIGLGNYSEIQPQAQQHSDITSLITAGDVPSMQRAKALIDQRIQEKVKTVAPAARPQPQIRLTPVNTPQQAPVAAPTQAQAPVPAPTPAPAPSQQSQSGISQNVLADLTKLIKAVGGLSGGNPSLAPQGGSGTALTAPVQAMPGRPTM